MTYHTCSAEEALKRLSGSPKGLTSKEVLLRQKQFGKNILTQKKKTNLFLRFLAQFKDFMILILIFAAVISFVVSYLEGNTDFVDPVIILLIIVFNAILGVIQEAKAEHSLEALQKFSAPSALVLRDGNKQTIPSEELVPGDILLLEAGQMIPADARLLEAINLKVDESALTGEAHSISKSADCILPENTPLGDRKNMVPATGMITYGRGTAVVTTTGMNTEVGHIAKLILNDATPDTPLQKRLAKTGKLLGIAALSICLFIFLLGILQGRPIFTMFMTAVSLAVASIPEGLPAIVTIVLSLGVQRMAKQSAVIRKLPAVETLGSATYICSDKTGTLTQNQMTVTEAASADTVLSLSDTETKPLLLLACLCNNSQINLTKTGFFSVKNKKPILKANGEPTENALLLAGISYALSKEEAETTFPRVYEIPFDSERKRMTTIHTCTANAVALFPQLTATLSETPYLAITKGAFDILLPRCDSVLLHNTTMPFHKSLRDSAATKHTAMTQKALRAIAVSYRFLTQEEYHSYTASQKTALQVENHLTYIGCLGMIDPPRPEVKHSVALCKAAGITPVMITGDYPETAGAIASELQICKKGEPVLTGTMIDAMDESTLEKNIYNYHVYARVSPEHKVRIVKALQRNGEVVAMTGDGINDAPALKAADIGCAMGRGGTDVAKNAADMILLDDNFATIVCAVKEGRGIYANIKRAVHFLLSCNIGEIFTILLAILFSMPSPLAAVQLLWVNLVTDSLPAIALGVEAPDKDIMKQPPIRPDAGMFSGGLGISIVLEGSIIGALALLAYIIGSRFFHNGSTMAFAVLSLSQLFHSFNMRSERSLFSIGICSNRKLFFSFLFCSALQIVVISVPALALVFQVSPMNATGWSIVLFLSALPIFFMELQKKFR
mgnify:CR=1 FL=1